MGKIRFSISTDTNTISVTKFEECAGLTTGWRGMS